MVVLGFISITTQSQMLFVVEAKSDVKRQGPVELSVTLLYSLTEGAKPPAFTEIFTVGVPQTRVPSFFIPTLGQLSSFDESMTPSLTITPH